MLANIESFIDGSAPGYVSMGESNTVVSAYTLYRPIYFLGTYNSIALTYRYIHKPFLTLLL